MKDNAKELQELNHWVKVQLVIQRTSLRKIAKQMDVAYPRLSEAINGQPSGKRYREPLIKALGGDINVFKAVI